MAKRIQHASRFLRGSKGVSSLLDSVEQSRALLQKTRDALPSPLDAHCLHAGIEEGVLTLVTDSPAWGSKLRFFAPELILTLSEELGAVERCKVRVQPGSVAKKPLEREAGAARLSENTVKLLLETADRLGERGMGETDLTLALRRLAKAGAARVG
jgi:hypothetical protein